MKNLTNHIRKAVVAVVLAVVLFFAASSLTNSARAENDPKYGPDTYTEKFYQDGHWYMVVYNQNGDPIIVIIDPTW